MADFHQTAGQNRAALVLRNGEQRPADHILERVLGQFKACALHLRQFRIFHRIETVDRRANARAANCRLHPLADRDVAWASRQLADDFAEQFTRQNGAPLLAERRGQQCFNAQRQIGAGQPQPFIAGFKQNAFQNRLGRAHSQRAADNGKSGIQFIGITSKAHFDNLQWGSSSIYVQQKKS